MITKDAFDDGYEEYEINGGRNMNLSLQQYIEQITPELLDLLTFKKDSTDNEQKVQLMVAVIFRHALNLSKFYTFYVKTKNTVMRRGDDVNVILSKLKE